MSSLVAFLWIYGGNGTVPAFSARPNRSWLLLMIASPSPIISITSSLALSTYSQSPTLNLPLYITLCLNQLSSLPCFSNTINCFKTPFGLMPSSLAFMTFVSFKISTSPGHKNSGMSWYNLSLRLPLVLSRTSRRELPRIFGGCLAITASGKL